MKADPRQGNGVPQARGEQIQILINDRVNPVSLEPYKIPKVRWRLDPQPTNGNSMRSARIMVTDWPEFKNVVSAESSEGCGTGFNGEKGFCWESGIRPIDEINGLSLSEIPMGPSRRYWVRIELMDDQGLVLLQSKPATFGTGPGRTWSAKAIWSDGEVPVQTSEGNSGGWAFLRGVIRIPDKRIAWATLNATASSTRPARQFVYRLWMNGVFQGCGPVFPQADEARYDGYDVSELLKPGGENCVGVIAYTASDRRFAAQLDVCFYDGQVVHYGTDSSWRALPGGEVFPDSASIGTQYYQAPAEDIVLSRYPQGFSTTDFDDESWPSATVKSSFDCCLASPVDSPRLSYLRPKCIRRTSQGSLLLDFGFVVMGGLCLQVSLANDMDLMVRYGEVVQNDGRVKYHISAGNVYEDRWQMASGENAAETWGIRVFRYVELSCEYHRENMDALVSAAHAGHVEAAALLAPVIDSHADFHSSQPIVDRVWKLGRDTVMGLNANIYVDSWTRERAPYEADAWIQQQAHQVLDNSPTVGRYTVDYLVKNRTWPTEWPLYSILAVHDAWMSTGDLRQARSRYHQLCALLPTRYLDQQSGLVVKDPGRSSRMDGDLVDWPESERDGYRFGRVNTVVNALSSRAFADMADLAGVLGHQGDADLFARTASRMRSAINETLFDPRVGAYWDGLDQGPSGHPLDHHSLHASAFVLAFADPPRKRIGRLGEFLRSRGMACSVYVAAVYLDGLYRAGLGTDATDLLMARTGIRTWNHMLNQGAGGTMEAWDPGLKPNTTYSHPWAASPVYLLPKGLMGIRPLEPGFRSFTCIPQPGGLDRAAVVLPLPSGDLSVSYEVSGSLRNEAGQISLSGIRMVLDLPQGSRMHLVLPPLTGVEVGDEVAVAVDGKDRTVTAVSGDFILGDIRCPERSIPLGVLESGHHLVSIASPST